MKQRFQTTLQNLKKKLAYWSTIKLSLASRILIANQVLLASIWYLASCWALYIDTLTKIKSLIKNYIWLGGNDERRCRAQVEWESLIQPYSLGGAKPIDPFLQIQTLLTKLMIRGLMPSLVP